MLQPNLIGYKLKGAGRVEVDDESIRFIPEEYDPAGDNQLNPMFEIPIRNDDEVMACADIFRAIAEHLERVNQPIQVRKT